MSENLPNNTENYSTKQRLMTLQTKNNQKQLCIKIYKNKEKRKEYLA